MPFGPGYASAYDVLYGDKEYEAEVDILVVRGEVPLVEAAHGVPCLARDQQTAPGAVVGVPDPAVRR